MTAKQTQRGATFVEYVLVVTLIGIVCWVFKDVLFNAVEGYYSNNNDQFNYIDTPVSS